MAKVMTRSELITSVAARTGQSSDDAAAAIDALLETFADSLAEGSRIAIQGWLGIERIRRPARTGRNPHTGEPVQIPAGYRVRATVGSRLKRAAG